MPTRTEGIHLHLKATFWAAVCLILTAFRWKVPTWSWDPLIGLPSWQALLDDWSEAGSEMLRREVNLSGVKPVRSEDALLDVEQRFAERRRETLPLIDARGVPDRLTVRAMSERYRIASSHSVLLSKEAQN